MSKDQDDRYDFLDYIDELPEEEKEFIKQFYREYYFDGVTGKTAEERVIKSEEAIKEARRNHNSMKTDMLFRAKKEGFYDTVNSASAEQFMEDASDEWEWQDAFKLLGFEGALKVITDQTIRDLDNKHLNTEIVLARYYEKRDRLRRVLNKEKRK